MAFSDNYALRHPDFFFLCFDTLFLPHYTTLYQQIFFDDFYTDRITTDNLLANRQFTDLDAGGPHTFVTSYGTIPM
jgi:hypothetical protein